MNKYYSVRSSSEYYREIQKSKQDQHKFKEVHQEMCEVMGLTPTNRIGTNPEDFWYDVVQLEDDGLKALFNKEGYLKRNSKQANHYRKKYIEIVEKSGLKGFKSQFEINFDYGFMRKTKQQKLETFQGVDTIFAHADFDVKESEYEDMSYLVEIAETDYLQAHLAAVKLNTERIA